MKQNINKIKSRLVLHCDIAPPFSHLLRHAGGHVGPILLPINVLKVTYINVIFSLASWWEKKFPMPIFGKIMMVILF